MSFPSPMPQGAASTLFDDARIGIVSVPRILLVSLLCVGGWIAGFVLAVPLLEEMGPGVNVLQGMAGSSRDVAIVLLAWSLPGAGALGGLVVAVRAAHRIPFRGVLALPWRGRWLGAWLAGGTGAVAVVAVGLSVLGQLDAGNLADAVALMAGLGLAVEAASTEAVRAYLVRVAVARTPEGWPSVIAGTAAAALPGAWLTALVTTLPEAPLHPAYGVAVVVAMGLSPGLFTLVDGRIERAVAWAATVRLAAGTAAVGGVAASPLLAGAAVAAVLAVVVALAVVEGWTLRGVTRTLMQTPRASSVPERSGDAVERDESPKRSETDAPGKAAPAESTQEASSSAERAADADAARDTCANCGTRAPGRYCAACGQRQSHPMTVLAFLRRSLAEIVDVDGRVLRTVRDYVPPGTVTRQYLAGKRRRYIRPFRLYLTTSFVFFLLVAYAVPEEPSPSDAAAGAPVDTVTVRRATYDSLVAASHAPSDAASGDAASADAASADAASATTRRGPRADAPVPDTSRTTAEEARVVRLAPVTSEKRADRALQVVLRNAAQMMFVLVPLFAFLLQVAFLKYTYVQHLIFTLHVHVFGFVVVSGAPLLEIMLESGTDATVAELSLSGIYAVSATLGVLAYVWCAMRRVYDVGWFRSLFVTLVLGVLYLFTFVFLLGFALGLVGTFITQ
jgi:hypothetical protein